MKKRKSKSGYRRSVSGRIYKGLQPHVRKRLEAKIRARAESRAHTSNKRGRPRKDTSYDKKAVDRANARLRRLENITKLYPDKNIMTEDSNEYRLIKKIAIEEPNARGRIYKLLNIYDEEGNYRGKGVRFITQRELEELAREEAEEYYLDTGKRLDDLTQTKVYKYYKESLEKVLDASTTTVSGIEEKFSKAYQTFMSHYANERNKAFIGLTEDDYKKFFRIFRDRVEPDRQNHFDYDVLSQALQWIDIGEALRDDQMYKIFEYIANNQWDKIEKKYITSNF